MKFKLSSDNDCTMDRDSQTLKNPIPPEKIVIENEILLTAYATLIFALTLCLIPFQQLLNCDISKSLTTDAENGCQLVILTWCIMFHRHDVIFFRVNFDGARVRQDWESSDGRRLVTSKVTCNLALKSSIFTSLVIFPRVFGTRYDKKSFVIWSNFSI